MMTPDEEASSSMPNEEQNKMETEETNNISAEDATSVQNGDEPKDAEVVDVEVEEQDKDSKVKTNNDVEKFDGKIVYNPDGSAYIIEDDADVSEDEAGSSRLSIPRQEGSIVDGPGAEDTPSGPIPQKIANAFYISKSSAYYNALYGQAYVKMLEEKNVPETPVVHSFRVFTPREEQSPEEENKQTDMKKLSPLMEYSTVPVKPILMCFICKLSFACSQSFGNHCGEGGPHEIRLNEEEKEILEAKNCSAIIQNAGGKGKEATVSFLEPMLTSGKKTHLPAAPPQFSPGAISNLLPNSSSAAASTSSSHSKVPSTLFPALPLLPPPAAVSPHSASVSPPAMPTTPDSLRKSPFEGLVRSGAPSPATTSPSPIALPLPPGLMMPSSPSVYPNLPTNANMLQGTTIGACPDHVNGRPTGIECSKCDLILNQSRLSGMGWNTARNSCKTLKCPKCNWHYKYQETLEIHMKEKHPESETTCIYCITGQQHPRLARGETYTCGYKPYRCEVCNYSTTTKGNLSIHMQSDKHLNNMQELQNGGMVPPLSSSSSSAAVTNSDQASKLPSTPSSSRNSLTPSLSTPLASPKQQQQQKPSWRCDVCNYETNVARNLRIHMTSEKHTHNMMSLQQQNAAKSMQQHLSSLPPGFPSLPLLPPTGSNGPPPPPGGFDPKQLLSLFAAASSANTPTTKTEPAQAMADLAYNQAVLAQLMTGGQFPGPPPPDFSNLLGMGGAGGPPGGGPLSPFGLPPLPNEEEARGADAVEINPRHLFTCVVCREFGCDSLDELSNHLSQDRSRTRENEVSIVIAGNYLCQLCNYKTNLKANFQLHCKTDKHLQRLGHVNHIKEGGPKNEWKLRLLTSLNPVELRCNACDFVTNNPHKLQVHVSNQQHQVSSLLFTHLKQHEEEHKDGKLSYNCTLCDFQSAGKHPLMQHVRTMKHLQMEQIHQLKKRAEGNHAHTDIGEIFQVVNEGKHLFFNSKQFISVARKRDVINDYFPCLYR